MPRPTADKVKCPYCKQTDFNHTVDCRNRQYTDALKRHIRAGNLVGTVCPACRAKNGTHSADCANRHYMKQHVEAFAVAPKLLAYLEIMP